MHELIKVIEHLQQALFNAEGNEKVKSSVTDTLRVAVKELSVLLEES